MDVGILGGTGPAGKALAARLASIGMSVSIGSRSAERGEEIAAQLREKWGGRVPDLHGASNEVACGADLVVVATPWDGAPQTVGGLAHHLDGKVVVSMANALFKVGDDIEAVVPRGARCAWRSRALPHAPSSRARSIISRPGDSRTSNSHSTRTFSCARITRLPPRPRSTS